MSDSATPVSADNKDQTMSKEDIAYFIRTMWESLLKPTWERGDLIDLGTAVFTKTTLAKMDQKKLGKLLPSLSIVAEHFGKLVRAKYMTEFESFLQAQTKIHGESPTPSTEPAPNAEPVAVEQNPTNEQPPAEPAEGNND
jgi:hypothetical protein